MFNKKERGVMIKKTKELGACFKKARLSSKVPRAQLGDKFNVNPQLFFNFESGRAGLPNYILFEASKDLKCNKEILKILTKYSKLEADYFKEKLG